MFAVPALRNGEKVELSPVPCMDCGLPLFFSHDEAVGEMTKRYASCERKHTWSFPSPTRDSIPIPVDQPGFLIDDSKPGWEAQIPDWAT